MRWIYFFLFIFVIISCKRSYDPVNLKPYETQSFYGTYDAYIYDEINNLITIGQVTLVYSDSDSITYAITNNFSDLKDSIGVAQYISDDTYKCKVVVDTLEFITASFPNFGIFLIRGVYSSNSIQGEWELWGHLFIEERGIFKAKRKD